MRLARGPAAKTPLRVVEQLHEDAGARRVPQRPPRGAEGVRGRLRRPDRGLDGRKRGEGVELLGPGAAPPSEDHRPLESLASLTEIARGRRQLARHG